ncbi:addiction module toxin, HicA family [bacterium]|nr:MAG: addiction module toxin, HicA family [bacterium]
MTGKELVRLLEKNGWEVIRIESSHHIMKKPGEKATLSIPVHTGKDIKPGLLNYFLKQAGLK